MASRDKERREKKKPKKDTKKLPQISAMINTTPVEVQVIKKGKQREGRKVEEEEE